MTPHLLAQIQSLTSAHAAHPGERLQSLWSGYGEVRRVYVEGLAAPSVVVKHVRPPPDAHPRKLRSYEVERAFYERWSDRCGPGCRVPRLYGAWSEGSERLFVLEDLDAAGFSERRRSPSREERAQCLRWLAAFHATFVGEVPEELWPVGTYWHLATRPDELRAMRDEALRREAPVLDAQLNTARYQTFVHGDAKPANFCFSPGGGPVAAVDFQYVGGGVGVRDVAYLLGAWRILSARARDAQLDLYFDALRRRLPAAVSADALEREWRGLYAVATRDFERFLDGWG